MEFETLESFIAVVKSGNFTRAAGERHLTQSCVSRHVQRLERELGHQLLERRPGGVELTNAGQQLLKYAEESVEHKRRFLAGLKSEALPLSGELRIAASTSPGEFLVPGLVARFTGLHPQVYSQVFIADSAEVIQELRERRWDLGFIGTRFPSRGLVYEEIAQDEVVLAVPPDHPFARRAEVALSELEGQRFLEREGGSGTLSSFRSALAYRGLPFPRYQVVMVLNSTQAMLSAVASGYGLGLVSVWALEHRSPSEMVKVRIKELPRSRPLYMVQERRQLPPVATSFAEWVKTQHGLKAT